MALSTYSELQASVAGWLLRSDLTARIPDFIALAESRLNKRLRTHHQEASATITLTDGEGDLPADYLEARAVWSDSTPKIELKAVSPGWGEETFSGAGAAYGYYYAIVGSTLKTYPPSASNLTMKYFGKIVALSDTDTTNWLLENYPDIYLYASLLESAPYLGDDERAVAWGTYLEQSISDLEKAEFRRKYMRVGTRVSGPTP